MKAKQINPLVWPLVILVVGLSFWSDVFLSSSNLFNIATASSVVIILGVGQTFLITSRNIDLSVGSMLALVAGLTGTYVATGGSVNLAILLAIGLGLFFGIINGLLVTILKVPALLATLGMLVAYRGAIQQYMFGAYHTRFPDSLVVLGQGRWGIVPVPVVIALSTAVVGSMIYHYTRLGRYAVAIGGNEEAAILAGINVRRWKVVFFGLNGMLVGLAAIILLARLNAAHPELGRGTELHVIAGVVLGGTSLFGGYGTVAGAVIAMLLIGVLENGLLLAGFGFFWQQIFLGLLIVFAVAAQTARQRKA